MKATPRKLKGGAQRVRKQAETPKHDEEMIMDQDATPTEASVKKYEFQAPKYHDFAEGGGKDEDLSSWFDKRNRSPQDPTLMPRNLLAETKSSPHQATTAMASSKNISAAHTMVLRKRSVKGPAPAVHKKTARKSMSKNNGMTIPKPFNLATAAKRTIRAAAKDPKSPFVPLAIKLQTFEKQVAERENKTLKRVQQGGKLTQPRSPMLSTRLRAQHNKTQFMTTQEKEELALKKVASFKARPVNKRILNLKPEIMPASKHLTVPMSPAIQKPKPKPGPAPEPSKVIKANPLPDMSKAFVPIVEHRVIEPTNFELPGDGIHKKRREEIAQKLEQEENELARQRSFKANPIAIPEKPFSVALETKVTEPAPFELKTDKRGEVHHQKFLDQLEKEQTCDKKAKQFHANPLPEAEPFIPARSSKPLTEIQPFQSHLDMRMEDRKAFEAEALERQQQEDETRREQEAQKKAREEQEIKRLRKEITHKAQPVGKYASVQIKPSDKKLTEPKTPRFVRRSARK